MTATASVEGFIPILFEEEIAACIMVVTACGSAKNEMALFWIGGLHS